LSKRRLVQGGVLLSAMRQALQKDEHSWLKRCLYLGVKSLNSLGWHVASKLF